VDLRGNPWTFVAADQSTAIAITSIVRNGVRSATVNAVAHGHLANDYISIQNPSVAAWAGGYRIESVIDANNFLIRIEDWRSTLSNAGAQGNVLTLIWPGIVDVTQMLWDAVAGTLLVTDAAGRLVWNPTAGGSGPATYMKAFPIAGLVLNTIPSGTLQISI
jgi:hypothetical protein